MRKDLLSVMQAVREKLYNGRAAPTQCKAGPWTELRDWSIAKTLVRRYGLEDTMDAVHGLALLRDSGKLRWAKPGTQMTLRSLVFDDRSYFMTARLAWQREQRAAHPVSVDSLGAILRKAMQA